MCFSGKKILVLGAGISGIAVARILNDLGAAVTLNDTKSADRLNIDVQGLVEAGIVLSLGRQDESLLDKIDIVVVSPGISIYIPLIEAAKAQGITVMSEVEVAYRLCRAPIIAITGTNGKTTTTTLIGEMLKSDGRETVVGGNIGLALSQEVLNVSAEGIVVAEISSFQLEAINEFRPHIAAVLNLTPDHIDRHRTYEEYKAMKERVFANQTETDYAVLNFDDTVVREMAAKAAPAKVFYFSRKESLPEGVYLEDGLIVARQRGRRIEIAPVASMKLMGAHNIENALAACAVALLAGVKTENISKVLAEFAGVEHRIEPVATIRGVAYYNDSKATNPESAIKALEAFPGHIILIAGGRDKNTSLDEFMSLVKAKTDWLILIGEAQQRFHDAAVAAGVENIRHAGSIEEAVNIAHALARPPQVVLLSPACASYDMFNNYEERGRIFKMLVRRLS